jgi:hypothetical protein
MSVHGGSCSPRTATGVASVRRTRPITTDPRGVVMMTRRHFMWPEGSSRRSGFLQYEPKCPQRIVQPRLHGAFGN